MRLLLLTFVILLTACGEVSAGGADAGLYDPKAPEGSAFVRFINMGSAVVTPKAKGKAYHSLVAGEASAYFVVPQGTVKVSLGGAALEKDLVAKLYYTAIRTSQAGGVCLD